MVTEKTPSLNASRRPVSDSAQEAGACHLELRIVGPSNAPAEVLYGALQLFPVDEAIRLVAPWENKCRHLLETIFCSIPCNNS